MPSSTIAHPAFVVGHRTRRCVAEGRAILSVVPGEVVVEWNGQDLPEQMRELPAGRYVLAPVDESVALSDDEKAGLIAALQSAETRVLSHEDVMDRARKILNG
jgi:hypothetical protein